MENKTDLQHIADELEFELDEVEMLIDVFLESSKAELEKLKGALEKNDLSDLYRSSHAIKGSAANLLLKDIAQLAENIEQKARNEEAFEYKENILLLEKMIDSLK